MFEYNQLCLIKKNATKLKIDITTETQRFQNHLGIIDNNQIIFSGIFGIGKTYFLKDFFKNNSDSYELFMLSPIHYSISQNDDIIDYIKYDLAFQLLSKGIDFEKTDFSTFLTSQYYLKDNFLDTLTLLAKSSNKIGKAIGDIFENFRKLVNNVNQHNSDFQIDEKEELIDFLKKIKNTNSSIFEENRITELVSVLIQRLKENSKEIVLVLDDVDRIDPEHIFRILNVFACHFDLGNFNENKFGFDKVILVCDIENIRNIFHSKYGSNVDFSGYIDKFYSREIFYFDNKEIVKSSIQSILKSIKTPEKYNHLINLKDERLITTDILQEILEDLINNDVLNLRTLLKLNDKEYDLNIFSFKIKPNNAPASNWQYPMIIIFDFLISLYGSKSSLKNAIYSLSLKNNSKTIDFREKSVYGILIALIDYRHHNSSRGDYTYINESLNIKIEYTIDKYGHRIREIFGDITKVSYLNETDKERADFPFSKILDIAFDTYINLEKTKN